MEKRNNKIRFDRVLKRAIVFLLCFSLFWMWHIPAEAEIEISAPCAILIEASTGQVIYEKNADEMRSPASITKIMTLLVVMDQLEAGRAALSDEILVSEYASSMGGSQVFLAQGEVQTLDTMLKCITVASGNDASVAVAEYVAGSEEAFVKMMNDRAASLGMTGTHFVDCCGLTDSDEHYTTARDVAIMSRELITKYPEIFHYTQIWMEDITHVTRQGSSVFTLSSTNKLLKRYPYTTGLKTGSTQKAKYCISATASKDGVDLIAVVMGAQDPKARFGEAQTLLTYGYAGCRLYTNQGPEISERLPVKGGLQDNVKICYEDDFRYLDMEGLHFDEIETEIILPQQAQAPVVGGDSVGYVLYTYHGVELGRQNIMYEETVERAGFGDCLRKAVESWLFS